MTLILVDRDSHEDVIAGLLPSLGIPTVRADLPLDYVFTGLGEGGAQVSVGVERKKCQDLVNSLRNGRLVAQFRRALGEGINELCFLFEDEVRVSNGGT